jgi:hypothetical protein
MNSFSLHVLKLFEIEKSVRSAKYTNCVGDLRIYSKDFLEGEMKCFFRIFSDVSGN